jgi:hypothetical protein
VNEDKKKIRNAQDIDFNLENKLRKANSIANLDGRH